MIVFLTINITITEFNRMRDVNGHLAAVEH